MPFKNIHLNALNYRVLFKMECIYFYTHFHSRRQHGRTMCKHKTRGHSPVDPTLPLESHFTTCTSPHLQYAGIVFPCLPTSLLATFLYTPRRERERLEVSWEREEKTTTEPQHKNHNTAISVKPRGESLNPVEWVRMWVLACGSVLILITRY